MNSRLVYSFIPVGAAIVAGGIQTAIIGYSFSAEQWYIAALLIVCVWLVAGMDAAAFHHSAVNGATWAQKIFLAISAVSLVLVLSVDLVWMFAPDAFNTTDAIIRDLSYATGINLAVSVFCLLAWIFFSQDHVDEREAAQMESNARREQRMAWLQSNEAKRFFGEEVRQDHIERIAKRRRRAPFAIAEQQAIKMIDQAESQEHGAGRVVFASNSKNGNGNGSNVLHTDAPTLPQAETSGNAPTKTARARKSAGAEAADPNA